MTQSIYLIGEPGSGKTTTINEYLTNFYLAPEIRLHRQLWAEPIIKERQLYGLHLGRRKPVFSGTDALGMAVNPDAITWINTANLPALILAEGQRLANLAFLTALHNKTKLTVIHITADNAQQRRQTRGTTQNPTWIKAAISRANNLTNTLTQTGINLERLDTTHLTPTQAAQQLQTLIKP